ncbi:MAG: ABC transporter ATP-binding protein [Hyphomicrobiaceae bacterium]
MLKIEKLSVAGLPPLTFSVAAGECLAVEGPSGSGKTRLLRAIADLDPAPGYVSLGGQERHEMSGSAWRRQVRYCAAEPAWWSPTARRHATPGPSETRFVRLALQLDVPEALLDRPIDELSTGERQRLALALALADEPKAILLDEPTGALDVGRSALVEEIIRFQLLAGRIVLLVSHNTAQVDRLAEARLELARTA